MCMYIDVHEMFRSITVISELRLQLYSVKVMATFQTKTYNVRVPTSAQDVCNGGKIFPWKPLRN